jgi:hypothetical protein
MSRARAADTLSLVVRAQKKNGSDAVLSPLNTFVWHED